MSTSLATSPGLELECDVLVVGAGPTGLMLACVLKTLGVDVVVLDGKSGTTSESRALALQSRTMEIYDQLGIVDEVLDRAWVAEALAVGFERRELGSIPLQALGKDITPYPAIHILEQSENERILYEQLQRLGGRVYWQHPLRDLADRAGGVLATTDGALETGTIRARWCVGADGGSSTVRALRGISFDGSTNEHSFYVADAIGVDGLVTDSANERLGSRDFLLSFPMGPSRDPDDTKPRNRLLGVARNPHSTAHGTAGPEDSDVSEHDIRSMLERVYGVTYDRSTWFATYRVHHRIAATFRDGPVFLVGDAAHVHSPVGGQGMNTGLQDAHNLATKLADVVSGIASDTALDRYEAERRPVAAKLVSTTDRIFTAVTSDSKRARFIRRRIVPVVVPVIAWIAPRLAGGGRTLQFISELRIHYWMSDGARRAAKGKRDRVIGRRLPWTEPGHAALRSMCWQIHSYGNLDEASASHISRRLRLAVHRLDPAPDRGLQPDTVYLVRPDGFVAAAASVDDLDRAVTQLAAALPDRWMSTPNSQTADISRRSRS